MKNRIQVLRKKLGMTQGQLGGLAGVSRQAINAVETGKSDPSIWLAYGIARVFGEPIESVFLFEKSRMKPRAQIGRGEFCGVKANQDV